MPNARGQPHNWNRIRYRLGLSSNWLLLGRGERLSVADALRNGRINAMQGVEVQTRNNRTDEHGVRRCDIYLRRERE